MNRYRSTRRRRVFGALAVALLFGLCTGCSSAPGEVKGKVLFGGKPVPGGRLTFRPADPAANSVSVLVNEQGEYGVTLPAGEVKVAFDNRELAPREAPAPGPFLPKGLSADVKKLAGAKAEAKAALKAEEPNQTGSVYDRPAGRYVPIPERYYEAQSSGLSFTVKSGAQTHDIELTK